MSTASNPDAEIEAEALLAQHGRRAHQIVIDAIVVAIKAGDEPTVGDRSAVLRALDRIAPE